MNVEIDFGTYLRHERELRRVPLSEVADATRIPLRTLESLELGRWAELPAEVFVRGFVRSYARHIGLPQQEVDHRYRETVLAAAQHEAALNTEEVGDAAAQVSTRRHFGLALFVILLLIIVTITFSLLWGTGANATSHASLDPASTVGAGVRSFFSLFG